MSHVPWYGPLYQEALRLEEKAERPHAALKIVHGLSVLAEAPAAGNGAHNGAQGAGASLAEELTVTEESPDAWAATAEGVSLIRGEVVRVDADQKQVWIRPLARDAASYGADGRSGSGGGGGGGGGGGSGSGGGSGGCGQQGVWGK